MSTKQTPPSNRLNIFVEGCDVPAAHEERDRLITDLKVALNRLTGTYRLDPDRIRIDGGHTFVEVERRCPSCTGSIALRYPELMENAAYAQAHCEVCDWSGTAIYRLIDLMTYAPDRESEIFDGFPFQSSVRVSDLQPQYIPYE